MRSLVRLSAIARAAAKASSAKRACLAFHLFIPNHPKAGNVNSGSKANHQVPEALLRCGFTATGLVAVGVCACVLVVAMTVGTAGVCASVLAVSAGVSVIADSVSTTFVSFAESN